MVQRDREAAMAYDSNKRAVKEMGRNMLNNENAMVIEQRRLQEEMNKVEQGRIVGTTIQQLGDGYPN